MNHDEFQACVNEVMDSLPLPERGVDYAGELPDVVYMFRLPHLEMGLSRTLRQVACRPMSLPEGPYCC